MPVEIVLMKPGDEALLDRVADDVFDAPIDPARLTAYLAETSHAMVVARMHGEVVGQARAIVHKHPDEPSELYVDNLGVAEGMRRQGIARRLMDALYDWGRAQGCVESWVGTEPGNDPAKSLYASYDAEEEAIVMYVREL
jgi:aminoglycoside 6'-N-acetyltransferase I